jgi:hypothetical protein
VSALESRLAAATKEAAQYKTDLQLQEAQCNQLKQAQEKYVEVSGYKIISGIWSELK